MNNGFKLDKGLIERQLVKSINSFKDTSFEKKFNITIGFDGFVDEIIGVVNKRQSFDVSSAN